MNIASNFKIAKTLLFAALLGACQLVAMDNPKQNENNNNIQQRKSSDKRNRSDSDDELNQGSSKHLKLEDTDQDYINQNIIDLDDAQYEYVDEYTDSGPIFSKELNITDEVKQLIYTTDITRPISTVLKQFNDAKALFNREVGFWNASLFQSYFENSKPLSEYFPECMSDSYEIKECSSDEKAEIEESFKNLEQFFYEYTSTSCNIKNKKTGELITAISRIPKVPGRFYTVNGKAQVARLQNEYLISWSEHIFNIWDKQTGEHITTKKTQHSILKFIQLNNHTFCLLTNKTIEIWDTTTFNCLISKPCSSFLVDIVQLKDGNLCLLTDKKIEIFDPITLECIMHNQCNCLNNSAIYVTQIENGNIALRASSHFISLGQTKILDFYPKDLSLTQIALIVQLHKYRKTNKFVHIHAQWYKVLKTLPEYFQRPFTNRIDII